MIHQVIFHVLTSSRHGQVLPSQLVFMPRYPRAVQKQNILRAKRYSPLRNPTQGCSCNKQLGWTTSPSLLFQP